MLDTSKISPCRLELNPHTLYCSRLYLPLARTTVPIPAEHCVPRAPSSYIHMSTNNIGATHLFQLSGWGDDIFPPSYLPLDVGADGPCQVGSKVSRRIYQHSDAVRPQPLIVQFSHSQVIPWPLPLVSKAF